METVYIVMEIADYDESRYEIRGSKFFTSKEQAIAYANVEIFKDYKNLVEEWLINDYYWEDKNEGLWEYEEKQGIPHYEPTEQELMQEFALGDFYQILELSKG